MTSGRWPGWDLVIFDCDGVLIDSELLTIRVEVALLAERGIAITTDEIIERYCGISMEAMVADLEARFGCTLGDEFHSSHASRFASICETDLQAMAGIEAVLDGIPGKTCIASSSSPERLRHTLGLVGLYQRFEPYIYSATMVARGKPAPDLFLLAAAQMAADPECCVVVEDSLPGVTAAVAAGMTAIGFVGGGHCSPGRADQLRSGGAVVVIDRMPELLPTLARLSRRLR
ncbi:MAG TPA: HAD family hydrolase [Stellaceae bacterium]|nr:HAD family hydrolase [Xanthobacteraceae bacterium]HXP05639.1 HAD family hydrolase [Stellaceae bacterium]